MTDEQKNNIGVALDDIVKSATILKEKKFLTASSDAVPRLNKLLPRRKGDNNERIQETKEGGNGRSPNCQKQWRQL